MSRVIVKNLPKNITSEEVRSLFSSKGTVTDHQLKYTSDGIFRQFCFIGYRSVDEAEEAIKYFNNSCIQAHRIKVELCSSLNVNNPPTNGKKHGDRVQSRESKNASENEKENGKSSKVKLSKIDEIFGKYKEDTEFKEFVKVHDPKRVLWQNDTINEMTANEVEKEEGNQEAVDITNTEELKENETKWAEKPISDLEYMKSLMKNTKTAKKSTAKSVVASDLFTIKMQNVPYRTKRQDIIKFFRPLKPFSIRLPRKVHGFCYVGFKYEREKNKAMLKSRSFIKSKQVFLSDYMAKSGAQMQPSRDSGDNVVAEGNAKWTKQKQSLCHVEDICESGQMFFRNIAYTVVEDDLQQMFEKFGPIAEIHLPVDSITRQIKGFGTVTYVMPEHAVQAFNQLDGSIFHGRLLHLMPGKSKGNDGGDDDDAYNDDHLSFKQKKNVKLKREANNHISWNTLFLGHNAIVEILARNFEMSKEKILDMNEGGGGSSAAVRIALGETQIVIELRKFLEDHGVCLSAFEGPVTQRSKTIILAKNLPANTMVEELLPVFQKFGPIGRFILPPNGVTALIEYCDPSEARMAFRKLAYSKYKDAPLYLEWAPEKTFTSVMGEKKATSAPNDVTETEAVQPGEETNETPQSKSTLFLHNLSATTDESLIRQHFQHLGAIHNVELVKSVAGAHKPTRYGFIQFKSTQAADEALKTMQFTSIDGRRIELKRSRATGAPMMTNTVDVLRKDMNTTKQTGTKIVVRNIAFQAKPKEVQDIFKAFGELRALRLPLKMGTKSHRGFGFVDFMSKDDAKRAFEAVCRSTHLYGKRLVLEWAATDDKDVETIRKRTAQEFQYDNKSGKRTKTSVLNMVTESADQQSIGADDMDE